jgi:predicted ferric reductase
MKNVGGRAKRNLYGINLPRMTRSPQSFEYELSHAGHKVLVVMLGFFPVFITVAFGTQVLGGKALSRGEWAIFCLGLVLSCFAVLGFAYRSAKRSARFQSRESSATMTVSSLAQRCLDLEAPQFRVLIEQIVPTKKAPL